jgi:hypothetical protein
MNFISRHCSSAANGLWNTTVDAVHFVDERINRNLVLGGICLGACVFQQYSLVLGGLFIGAKWHIETNEFFDKISAIFDYYLHCVDNMIGGWKIGEWRIILPFAHGTIFIIAALAYKILLPVSIVIITPVFCGAMLSANLVTAALKYRAERSVPSED